MVLGSFPGPFPELYPSSVSIFLLIQWGLLSSVAPSLSLPWITVQTLWDKGTLCKSERFGTRECQQLRVVSVLPVPLQDELSVALNGFKGHCLWRMRKALGQEVCDLLVSSTGGNKMAPVLLQEEGPALMATELRNPPPRPPEQRGRRHPDGWRHHFLRGLVEFAMGLIPGLDK